MEIRRRSVTAPIAVASRNERENKNKNKNKNNNNNNSSSRHTRDTTREYAIHVVMVGCSGQTESDGMPRKTFTCCKKDAGLSGVALMTTCTQLRVSLSEGPFSLSCLGLL